MNTIIRKKILSILVSAIVIVVLFNCITYAMSGKNVWTFFFGEEEKDMSYIMEEYNQSITIDDYTISLENAIFDDMAEAIYCMIRVSKNEKKVEASILKYNNLTNSFGEDGRFSIWVDADTGGSGALKGEYDGNDLIIYARFIYHCDIVEDSHAIYLFDGKANKVMFENYAAKFELTPTTQNLKIENDKVDIYFSPIAVKIVSCLPIETEILEVQYKDGTVIEIVNVEKNKGIGGASISQTKSNYAETYTDFELIDIEQVEFVIYNGIKIEPVGEK